MQRLITIMRAKGIRLTYKIKGHRLLIQELMPHPQQKADLLVPFALIDYKNDTWHLLFRNPDGHWQPVPCFTPSANIDSALNAVIENHQALF